MVVIRLELCVSVRVLVKFVIVMMILCCRFSVVIVLFIGFCICLLCDIVMWWFLVKCVVVIVFLISVCLGCIMLMKWLWNRVWVCSFGLVVLLMMFVFRFVLLLCRVVLFLLGLGMKCSFMWGVLVVMCVSSVVLKVLMKFLCVCSVNLCFSWFSCRVVVGCSVVCVFCISGLMCLCSFSVCGDVISLWLVCISNGLLVVLCSCVSEWFMVDGFRCRCCVVLVMLFLVSRVFRVRSRLRFGFDMVFCV